MAKKPDITTIASGYYSRQALNTNFENLQDGFDNTLSLDGSTPNSMGADFDVNGNNILNAGQVDVDSLYINGVSLVPGDVNLQTTYLTASYTGDGSTVAYALTANPQTEANTSVYVDGVYQNKATYSLSGTTVTFSEAPPLNAAIEIVYPTNTDTLNGSDASAITYNQGGTGAQDRTVRSKLQEFVSVKDFGAVGDGVADDTAAIQAALDAVGVLSNAVIYFPAGTYISQKVTINYHNTWIVGQDATLKLKDGTNDDLLYIADGRINIRITGMTFDGNQQNQTSGNCYCINSYRSQLLKINDNRFINFKISAIYAYGHGLIHQRGLTINGNFIDGSPTPNDPLDTSDLAGTKGILIDYNIYRATIAENNITNCEYAIWFQNTITATTITSNNIYSNGTGVAITTFDCAANTIVGNNFNNNTGSDINGVAFSTLISGNTFYECVGTSIFCYGNYDLQCFIEGNYFRTCPTAVAVDTNSKKVSIKNNFVYNGSVSTGSSSAFNTTTGTESCEISGNTIQNVRGDGISVDGSYHTIDGNEIVNCGIDGSNVRYGIDVVADYCKVSNNVIDDDQGSPTSGGIRFNSGADNSIIYNNHIIRYNGSAGEYVDNGSNNTAMTLSTRQALLSGQNPQLELSDTSTSGSLFLSSDYLSGGSDHIRADTNNLVIAAEASAKYVMVKAAGTEVLRAKAEGSINFKPLASDPSGAAAGDVYYNSSTNKLRCYNGTSWNDLF